MRQVGYRVQGGVAALTMNTPPVKSLGSQLRQSLFYRCGSGACAATRCAEQVRLSEVVRALRRIAGSPGAHRTFRTPAALAVRLAEEGKHFSGYKGSSK